MQQQDYASQIHRCFRCGYCKFPTAYVDFNCPPYKRFRFDTYSTGGRLWLTKAWLDGDVEWSERLADILYTCTMCRNCVEQCPMRFAPDIVDWIVGARGDMVERGKIPPQVARFFEAVHGYGNPLKLLKGDRAAWADGTKRYAPGDEYLGEVGLFNMLAEQNTQQFKDLGVNKVVNLSPHAYNTMKNNYPAFGANFEVCHYTQLLYDLIRKGKIKPSQNKAKVTYQDPCFLGRYNQIYDEPREVLQRIPGIELVEMKRNRRDAFCCGGGSGNFIMDLLAGSEESPSRVRVREAYATGADTLAVACPSCLTMFTDAIKAEDLDDKLVVKDISQIVNESLAGK